MMSVEIILILILVLANGVFAMAEIAVVSSRKARLQERAENGDKRARVALALANDPNEFLSTIQVGITLIGTLAGAFGGATIAEQLALYLQQSPSLAPHAHTISMTAVVVAITYLSLILGELVPKRLGLSNPERLAAWVAPPMRFLSRVMHPIVRFLGWSTNLVFRLIPIYQAHEAPVTEEEIKVLIEQGTEHGTFEESEQEMVEGVFRLGDRRVVELMTPRHALVWLDVQDSLDANLRLIVQSTHSVFPVGDGSLDQVLGVASLKDLFARLGAGQPLDLRAVAHKPLFLPETARALAVLEQFRTSGVHMALIVNEHGVIEGLVTMYDLLQAVVGEMPQAGEPQEPGIREREEGIWIVKGGLPVADFKARFNLSDLPGEEDGGFNTVAGFLMTQLGRVPTIGEFTEWNGRHLEVVEMEGNRIEKLLFRLVPVPDETVLPTRG